jgi:hypothetical protein
MSNRLTVKHYPNRRCRFSESVDFEVNGKSVPTPTFAPRLKNDNELNIFLEMKSTHEPKQLSAFTIRLIDVKRTIQYRLKKTEQTNLFGQPLDVPFAESLKRDIILIDPALEYLFYYNMLDRLKTSVFMSNIIRKYAEKISHGIEELKEQRERLKDTNEKPTQTIEGYRDAQHTNFWTCIYKDANKRIKLIRDTYTAEMMCRADVLIPPVPLITCPHLLNVSIDMNEKFRALAEDKGECADYFVLKRQMLKNESIMDKIKTYVSNSESRLTIFKVKDFDLTNADYALERSSFGKLLEELFLVSQHVENKSFALFEAGYQAFPAALCSFAIVSTAFNLDRDDRRATQGQAISEFANWYDPNSMTMRNRDVLIAETQNNGGVVPCHCPECTSGRPLTKETPIEYNKRVKKHFLHTRENEMREIVDSINRQNVSMAFEKLERSDLRILSNLIPR